MSNEKQIDFLSSCACFSHVHTRINAKFEMKNLIICHLNSRSSLIATGGGGGGGGGGGFNGGGKQRGTGRQPRHQPY